MQKVLVFILALLNVFTPVFSQEYNIIPRPFKIEAGNGEFIFNSNTVIFAEQSVMNEAALFVSQISASIPFQIRLKKYSKSTNNQPNSIVITVDKKSGLGNEEYVLKVSTNQISIVAGKPAGAFYALQTLMQLLPVELFSQKQNNSIKWSVPCITITDKPRFGWRAFLLDEARYFKGKEVVFKLLDQMALHKLNIFQWHLTDDQGWRIEIKKYPKLTEFGSNRSNSQIVNWESNELSGKPHGGFYTQDEIKEIIQYASARHITIVPEIEMPGHATAAIASYPWLGSNGRAKEVSVWFKNSSDKDALNVTKPEVMKFCQEVLTEVMNLFPSQVIHIGGDEVKYENWKSNDSILQFMKVNDIESPAELQLWFINQVSNFIASKNKRMMGWNEIMGGKIHEYHSENESLTRESLSQNAIVHFWKGDLDLVKDAVSRGYDVVNSYHLFTYLDYLEDVSMRKAYSFDPIPEGLDKQYNKNVLGAGCQMWGEWIPETSDLYDRVFPKMSAYSESFWSQKDVKDYENFKKRLNSRFKIWTLQGISFHQYNLDAPAGEN